MLFNFDKSRMLLIPSLRSAYRKLFYVYAVHALFLLMLLGSIWLLNGELSITKQPSPLQVAYQPAASAVHEAYSPQLRYITSVDQLLVCADSMQRRHPAVPYPSLLSWLLRQRFYHGFSYFGDAHNRLAGLIANYLHTDWHAIVIPNDILQYPNAGCSQQSIVFMAALRQRAYRVRKVGFYEPKQGGHYALEVYYNDAWHYFDTDFEPDFLLLNQVGRPSISALVADTSLLQHAYAHRMEASRIRSLFKTYQIGEVNATPAPRAYLFQAVTKAITYSGWLVVAVAWWIYGLTRHSKKRMFTYLHRQVPVARAIRPLHKVA
ncbi:hypothetical protein [Hymenobacter mucosus]|nr:hypothetical protein [Hymenobacter mucosus]